MGKFYGSIGYAVSVEKSPGVWAEEVTERPYYGDENRVSRRLQSSENIHDDLTVNNEITIIADPFAYENFHSIKYIRWMGACWKVINIEVRRPRLILTIGGVYNGETAPAPDTP